MKKWLCMLVMILMVSAALAQTVQDDALAFLQSAGIEADSVMRIDNEIIVTLMNGGSASLWTYGDFDMYDLSWRFQNATDEDVALYLDHALGMLAVLEAKIPADSKRVQGYAALVDSGLDGMTALGAQGMRVLIVQIFRTDDSGLNGLRGRLIERMIRAE